MGKGLIRKLVDSKIGKFLIPTHNEILLYTTELYASVPLALIGTIFTDNLSNLALIGASPQIISYAGIRALKFLSRNDPEYKVKEGPTELDEYTQRHFR